MHFSDLARYCHLFSVGDELGIFLYLFESFYSSPWYGIDDDANNGDDNDNYDDNDDDDDDDDSFEILSAVPPCSLPPLIAAPISAGSAY